MLEEIRVRGKKTKFFVTELGKPRFSEVDSYGIVWNGNFVQYFEEARFRFFEYFGVGIQRFEELGYVVPVPRYEIKMSRPVLPNDKITVAVRPQFATFEYSAKNLPFQHLLLVNGEVRAQGTVHHMLVRKDTMDSFENSLSKEVMQLLQPMIEEFSGAEFFAKLTEIYDEIWNQKAQFQPETLTQNNFH